MTALAHQQTTEPKRSHRPGPYRMRGGSIRPPTTARYVVLFHSPDSSDKQAVKKLPTLQIAGLFDAAMSVTEHSKVFDSNAPTALPLVSLDAPSTHQRLLSNAPLEHPLISPDAQRALLPLSLAGLGADKDRTSSSMPNLLLQNFEADWHDYFKADWHPISTDLFGEASLKDDIIGKITESIFSIGGDHFAGVLGLESQTSEPEQIEPSPSILASLDGLEEYSFDNWDLEGAHAVTQDAIKATEEALRLISDFDIPPEVAPAADGTVCMEWVTPVGLLWVDIGPDRAASVLKKINGEREEKRFKIHEPDFAEYLRAAIAALFPDSAVAKGKVFIEEAI